MLMQSLWTAIRIFFIKDSSELYLGRVKWKKQVDAVGNWSSILTSLPALSLPEWALILNTRFELSKAASVGGSLCWPQQKMTNFLRSSSEISSRNYQKFLISLLSFAYSTSSLGYSVWRRRSAIFGLQLPHIQVSKSSRVPTFSMLSGII